MYWTLSVFDWREDVIRDSLGKPLELPLKAGRHEIRLAYPTAGLNLDVLRLRGTQPDPVH